MNPSFPSTDPDLVAMTESELTAAADSAGSGVGTAIGGEITGLDATHRKKVLELINMLMRMMGG